MGVLGCFPGLEGGVFPRDNITIGLASVFPDAQTEVRGQKGREVKHKYGAGPIRGGRKEWNEVERWSWPNLFKIRTSTSW